MFPLRWITHARRLSRWRWGLLLYVVWAPGCAVQVRRTVVPPAAKAQKVEVYFVTDRKPEGGEVGAGKEQKSGAKSAGLPPRFGHERSDAGEMRYGRAEMCVPAGHRVGEFLPENTQECGAGAGHTEAADHDVFFRMIAERLERSDRKQILVFVHGYDFAFEEGLRWTPQLESDLNFSGAVILYSWPSKASALKYLPDVSNAEWSMAHLEQFLVELAAREPGSAIHLIGYSLGGRALLRTLDGLARRYGDSEARMFGQIVFAAPDVDADVFRQLAPGAVKLGRRVTLYASSNDKVLGASARLNGYPRAGDTEFDLELAPAVDTVDATSVTGDRLHHNYFLRSREMLADLYQLLQGGLGASERFGLRRVDTKLGTYWRVMP